MAEKSSDASPGEPSGSPRPAGGNWWDSWITSAKSKSAEVYSMVKKDLDEIGSAVKSEASHVLTSTSTAIGKTFKLDEPESPANVMKKSLSTFIGQVSTVLNPEPDDEDDTEVILSSGDTTMLSTYKKELEALQRVDATFIVPADSPEFEAWHASLELSDSTVISTAAAAKRLAASPVLRSQFDRLVPDAVSREDFWERYLFRVALLQDRLAAASRKQPLEQPSTDPVLANLPMQAPVTPAVIQESPKKTLSKLDMEEPDVIPEIADAVSWEDEDFANDLELTEEQQTLLLEEYEREIADKKLLTKQTSTKDIVNNNLKNKTTNTAKAPAKKLPQTREKLNNKSVTDKPTPKATTDKPGAKPIDKTSKPSTDKQQPSNRLAKKPASKTTKATKKTGKADVCGNDLVEDYFGDKEPQKDDASSNSDESWEKEFEIEDVEQKA